MSEGPWTRYQQAQSDEQGPWTRFAGPEKPGVVEDVAKTIPAGLARGAAQVAGLPALGEAAAREVVLFPEKAYNYFLGDGTYDEVASLKAKRQEAEQESRTNRPTLNAIRDYVQKPSAETITQGIESVTGPLYKPQTTAGQYFNTAAEFAPGALLGVGTAAQRAAQVVVPALASETAGQLTEGSEYEGLARAAGALAGAGGTALFQSRTPERVLQSYMQGVDKSQLDEAGRLMEAATAQGVTLTWPEAISKVSGLKGPTNLQRVVENSAGGSGVLDPIMAARPAQIDQAARRAMNAIGDAPPNPSGLGREAQRAAEGVIDEGAAAINRATRPMYEAAQVKRIDPQSFAAVKADPVFQEGLKSVRNDRFIGPTLKDLPDDSVQVIDAVKKWFDETARNLRDPGNANRSNYSASIIDQGNRRMVQAADEATGSAPGVMGDYEAARAAQSQLREKYLQPLMDGPLGKLAEKDMTTKKAINTLFPNNPLPNSAEEISTAISALSAKKPGVSNRLVRTYLESAFNETAQALQSGANQFGGAGFAAAIRGNAQQRANLEAAIKALPDGETRLTALNKFLDVVEATGTRQRTGSQTAFNTEALQTLRKGGPLSELATSAAGGGITLPARIRQAFDDIRLGRNTEKIAKILVDPNALPLLNRLAKEPATSSRAVNISARLLFLGESARSQANRNAVPNRSSN